MHCARFEDSFSNSGVSSFNQSCSIGRGFEAERGPRDSGSFFCFEAFELVDDMIGDGPYIPGETRLKSKTVVDYDDDVRLASGSVVTPISGANFWRRASNRVASLDFYNKASACCVESIIVEASGVEAMAECEDVAVDVGHCAADKSIAPVPAAPFKPLLAFAGKSAVRNSDGPWINLNPGVAFSANLGYIEIRTIELAEIAAALIRLPHKRSSAVSFVVEYPSDDGPPASLQICAGDICFIFRLRLMGGLGPVLTGLLADPTIVKVGYGCEYDVRRMLRDWSVLVVPALDVADAAKVLGYEGDPVFPALVEAVLCKRLPARDFVRDWGGVNYDLPMVASTVNACIAILACYERVLGMVVAGHPKFGTPPWPSEFKLLLIGLQSPHARVGEAVMTPGADVDQGSIAYPCGLISVGPGTRPKAAPPEAPVPTDDDVAVRPDLYVPAPVARKRRKRNKNRQNINDESAAVVNTGRVLGLREEIEKLKLELNIVRCQLGSLRGEVKALTKRKVTN